MKKNIGQSAVELVVAWLCVIGLVIISVWSFIQTKNFFESAIQDSIVAYGLAFAVQYGQNFLLFAKNRAKSPNWMLTIIAAFVICAAVDAGTNVAELFRSNPQLTDNIAAMIIMVVVAIGVVFVEEVMAMAFAWALNNTNELIKSSGGDTINALEWLETETRKFDPRGAR
jgi:uncharacterized membrane protein